MRKTRTSLDQSFHKTNHLRSLDENNKKTYRKRKCEEMKHGTCGHVSTRPANRTHTTTRNKYTLLTYNKVNTTDASDEISSKNMILFNEITILLYKGIYSHRRINREVVEVGSPAQKGKGKLAQNANSFRKF